MRNNTNVNVQSTEVTIQCGYADVRPPANVTISAMVDDKFDVIASVAGSDAREKDGKFSLHVKKVM